MSKIYLTGMTSSHTSKTTNERSIGYAGLLYRALTALGHEVTWGNPTISTSVPAVFDQYDAFVIGVAPLGSMTSNRAYGALSMIEQLYGDPRLTLFVDAPDPAQIARSLRSVRTRPADLTKPIFSRRPHFDVASEPATHARLQSIISRLATDDWPPVLYPGLPWDNTLFKSAISHNMWDRLVPLNLDAQLIQKFGRDKTERRERWAADPNPSSWVSLIQRGLVRDVAKLPSGIGRTDDLTEEQLLDSIGVIIGPHKKTGTWWTPLYVHAMNTNTPVVTEWRESERIGPSWSLLAAQIESMAPMERFTLAKAQRHEYISKIPSVEDGRKILEKLVLRSNTEGATQ